MTSIVIPSAIINVLPSVGASVEIFFTVRLADNTLNEATITSTTLLYGSVNQLANNLFIPFDNKPIAFRIIATFDDVEYCAFLYTKAVYGNIMPDNLTRLIQHTAHGVFDSFASEPDQDNNELNIQLILYVAIANMINDYYNSLDLNISYFYAVSQVFSTTYSPSLEFEYNSTVGLLSTSTYPNQLFQLLATLGVVFCNVYDLELFVSRYIYYRIGIQCAVYLDDHVDPPGAYWILNSLVYSVLGTTTILAPDNYQPILKNLKWKIFNASTFTQAFKNELTSLIVRISRADLGNTVVTTLIVDPTDDDFTLVGPTYLLDPRLLTGKCLKYIGDDAFPLNVIGYVKNT